MKAYFSHDEGARNDPKLVEVLMALGHEGKSVYWDLVEMLYEQGGHLMLSQCKGYAFALRTNCDLILRLVNDFGLFVNDGTKFWSETALRRLEQRNAKSAKAKESASKRWAASERNANALPTQSEGNAIKEKEIKEKPTNAGKHTPEPEPSKSKPVERRLPLPAEDVLLFNPADWPSLKEPARFAQVCAQLGFSQVDFPRYRLQILASLEGREMPAASLRNWIKTYLNNDSDAGKLLLAPVQVPNDIPSNWPAGTPYTPPTGGRIPNMSEVLNPNWKPPQA